MSTLRDQILARIDETPHRPPAFVDIFRACLEPLQNIKGRKDALLDCLQCMIECREIDTETGTDGLTYRRAPAEARAILGGAP